MKLLATLVASTYAAAGTDYSGKLEILETRMRFHRETFDLSFYFFVLVYSRGHTEGHFCSLKPP